MEGIPGVSPAALLQGGAFLLVAWLFFQTFKSTLPKLAETFALQAQAQRDAFQEESRAQRELFQKELNEQRNSYEKTLKEIEIGFVGQINTMFLGEIRQQRSDFKEELSKQRHSLVNIINYRGLRNQELEEMLRANGIDPDSNDIAAHGKKS